MSLATRLVILLVIPFVVCVTAFAISTVRLRRALMFSEADRELRDAGSALQLTFHAVSRGRSEGRYTELAENLTQAVDRIQGVVFFDANGVLLGASRTMESHRDALAPLVARVHESGHAEFASYAFGDEPTYAYAIPVDRSAADPKDHAVAIIFRNLAYIERNIAQFTREVAVVAAGVTLGLTISLWLLLRRMVARPLSTLLGGVESVAAGDLAVAMPIRRRDEIGRLASAFNHMTASLRSAAAELELKSEANIALERRLQHAQRLTLIGQLTASIAHQIGSPLNVILGRARYALKSGGQNERDRRHFREIAAGAERVSRIIERLLSQARRVRGPVAAVDMDAVIRETMDFLSAECDRRGIVVHVQSRGDLTVEGRRDELEQVILNLCLNAIQAQPKGGRLTIIARRVGNLGATVQVDVLDGGPGVPSDLRETIFEPFFTTKSDGKGTGLGLAICDEMVRRQGGTIRVDDAREGGAVFRVTLPWRARPPSESALEAT